MLYCPFIFDFWVSFDQNMHRKYSTVKTFRFRLDYPLIRLSTLFWVDKVPLITISKVCRSFTTICILIYLSIYLSIRSLCLIVNVTNCNVYLSFIHSSSLSFFFLGCFFYKGPSCYRHIPTHTYTHARKRGHTRTHTCVRIHPPIHIWY